MTHCRLIGIAVLFAALGIPASAASGREMITAGQVAVAIGDAGLPVSASQITLLTDVVAKTSAPVLRVLSVGAWEGNLSVVRLACAISEECLPFVVTVRRHQNDRSKSAIIASNPQPAEHPSVETSRSKIVVRTGSPAILLLEGGHVHIQLAVICLENGIVGQTIRVEGRERGHTYLAEVCSDGLLRGTL
ncbi:MAG: hypothetical protein ABR971_02025 [Acidobacteriaceae bacterium]|jgi:D-ribose pyranose/furanose isomerase RbsD